MTTERTLAIAVPIDSERRGLIADIGSAASRAEGAEPGFRDDVIRFEALCAQLDAWAILQREQSDVVTFPVDSPPSPSVSLITNADVPEWVPGDQRDAVRQILTDGGALLLVTIPLERGDQPAVALKAPPPPSRAWRSKNDSRGTRAVKERFEDQLKDAVNSRTIEVEPFSPSGVSNRVLTETLREFVNATNGSRRVDVAVDYRDGSRAQNKFPLRCVRLGSHPTAKSELTLAFSLLSIRHAELDPIVDGAWLRNLQISQPRSQAETDDLVYETSRSQLLTLTEGGQRAVELAMYQTGLEPAIVGLYRAVTNHLIDFPGSLTVVPKFFQEPQRVSERASSRNGRRGSAVKSSDARRDASASDLPEYGNGKPWTNARSEER